MNTSINKLANTVGYVFAQYEGDILLAMQEVADILPNEIYWETLGTVWNRSFNVNYQKEIWLELFKADRPHQQCFMTKQERKVFYRLPEVVTIYQVMKKHQNYHDNFSYCLDHEQAKTMAKYSKLLTLKVPVSKIFAYVNYQNRNEIILF